MKPIPDAPAGTPAGESAAAAPAPITPGNGAAPPAGDTPAEGQSAKAAAPSPSTDPTPEPEPEELASYTDADLKAAYKSLPDAVRKANQKIFTETKMKLGDAGRLGEALLKDPVAFAKELAKKLNLKVEDTPQPGAPATPQEQAKAVTDELVPFFRGDVASAKAFESVLTRVINDANKPYREAAQAAAQESVMRAAEASKTAWLAKHPDASKHEKAMGEYMLRVTVADDVSDEEFLDMAYSYATRNERASASAQESVDRLNASAAAQAGNGTAPAGAAPIAPAPPQANPTASQAVAAALRNERWS